MENTHTCVPRGHATGDGVLNGFVHGLCVSCVDKTDVSNERTRWNCFYPIHSTICQPTLPYSRAVPIVLVHFDGFTFRFALQLCVKCSHDCSTSALHFASNDQATRIPCASFFRISFIRQFIWIVRTVVGCAPEIFLFFLSPSLSLTLFSRSKSKLISNFRIYYALDSTNLAVILVDIINILYFIARLIYLRVGQWTCWWRMKTTSNTID